MRDSFTKCVTTDVCVRWGGGGARSIDGCRMGLIVYYYRLGGWGMESCASDRANVLIIFIVHNIFFRVFVCACSGNGWG